MLRRMDILADATRPSPVSMFLPSRLCVLCQIAAQDPDARYALGSVLSHVLLHQTIIGEEALLQMAKVGETPDLLVRPYSFA